MTPSPRDGKWIKHVNKVEQGFSLYLESARALFDVSYQESWSVVHHVLHLLHVLLPIDNRDLSR